MDIVATEGTKPAESENTDGIETTPAPAADDSVSKIRKRLSEEGKARIAAEAELAKYRAAEQAKADEDAKARGEFEKILADRDAKLTEYQSTLAAKDRAIAAAEAKAMLTGLNNLELKGALADMPADIQPDGVAAWVEQFKASNAELFDKRAPGVGNGSSGSPHQGTNQSWKVIQETAKSSIDLKERKEARAKLTEYFQEHGRFPE